MGGGGGRYRYTVAKFQQVSVKLRHNNYNKIQDTWDVHV